MLAGDAQAALQLLTCAVRHFRTALAIQSPAAAGGLGPAETCTCSDSQKAAQLDNQLSPCSSSTFNAACSHSPQQHDGLPHAWLESASAVAEYVPCERGQHPGREHLLCSSGPKSSAAGDARRMRTTAGDGDGVQNGRHDSDSPGRQLIAVSSNATSESAPDSAIASIGNLFSASYELDRSCIGMASIPHHA